MATKPETVEVVEESMDSVESTSRKAARTYLGLMGLIYDESMNLFEQARDLVSRAEERGQEVEVQTRREVERYYRRAEEQLMDLRRRFMRIAERRGTAAEDRVETQIENLLMQMGVPSRNDVERLGQRIDELIREIDGKLLNSTSPAVTAEPFKGYQQLTVREVNNRLEKLSMSDLNHVKQYEMAHENRVTILREVDRLLDQMPITRYDELTVDEVTPLLGTLDAEQLTYIKSYEKAHENRVTLLSAIDNEMQERPPVNA